ncbi:17535_t:CDS:1, partial [Gigaspora margarita]
SSAPVESKQTISSHAPSLILLLTLPTMASQQTESITDPDQTQSLIPQIGQLLVPNNKVPCFDTEVLILTLVSITIYSEKTLKGMEIDLNLDIASAMSTIESNSPLKSIVKLLVVLKYLNELPTQLY